MADRVVIVGDSHLGPHNRADEPSFHQFLEAVPQLGERLILMGDLFEFWFGYRRAIPRDSFKTVAGLARVVDLGVQVEMFGGNHDRWAGGRDSFWATDLGIPFHTDGADLTIAGRKSWVHHGDGLAEAKLGSKVMHRVTRSPLTIALFRAIHPDFGFKLTDKLATVLSETNKTAEAMDASAAKQERFARDLLERRPDLSLVLLAHTHRQRLVEHAPGRFYLNAGQWMGERQYACIHAGGIWIGSWPKRPSDDQFA
jgi:UDP-2,3-diacylglucosamine hydrolase